MVTKSCISDIILQAPGRFYWYSRWQKFTCLKRTKLAHSVLLVFPAWTKISLDFLAFGVFIFMKQFRISQEKHLSTCFPLTYQLASAGRSGQLVRHCLAGNSEGPWWQMFFLTDSNFFYIIASRERGFVFGTFGLGWKNQGRTASYESIFYLISGQKWVCLYVILIYHALC